MQGLFKVPDAQMRKIALGSLPGTPFRIKKSLQQVIPLFDPIDKPKPSDWLWDHQQEGQSFPTYQKQMHNVVDPKRNVIYVKPLQKNIDKKFITLLIQYCQCFFYPMKVKMTDYSNIIDKVDSRINQYTGKKQVHARQILQKLQSSLKPDAFCLVAVTTTDLYPKDQWNFVFGIASLRDRTGVFSFARYDQSFFTQKNYEVDYEKILWRSIAVMVHQTTHMFGVRHCIFYNCVMNGSNHDQQSARRPLQLCPVCLRKLQSNIKFDILERYMKIQQFLEKYAQGDKRVNGHKNLINTLVKNISQSLKQVSTNKEIKQEKKQGTKKKSLERPNLKMVKKEVGKK